MCIQLVTTLLCFVYVGPPALIVNITKNITNSSIVIKWDAVDDSLPTIFTITWSRAGGDLQVATLTEQTSHTIAGLTLDTVYTITVSAANLCGSGPEFRTSISLSTDTTFITSSIKTASSTIPMNIASTDVSSIFVTTDMISPSTINSVTVTDNKNIGIASTITSVVTTTAITRLSTTHIDILSTNPADTTTSDENSKFSSIV